jgi:hypothetical protein
MVYAGADIRGRPLIGVLQERSEAHMNGKEKVIAILKSYPHKKRQIEQLRFELENPAEIGGDELIAGLSLGGRTPDEGGEKAGEKGGRISNRTMMIAMRYEGIAENMNADTIMQINKELRALEAETERLEHYLSLLQDRQAEVLRRYYFDSATWFALENELHMSRSGLLNYRNAAIKELVSMYNFISKVTGRDSGGAPEA